jgi:hypothetical protein
MRERLESVLITGADAGYFDLLEDLLRSLKKTGAIPARPIGILDFGLTDEQLRILRGYSDLIVKPHFDLRVPPALRRQAELGRLSRPFLPQYFPGFEYYVWIDADIWVQDARFIDDYLAAARRTGLAIVKESERAYRLQPWLISWSVKNFVSMFGLLRGLYLCACTPINNGLFVMAADAPHWEAWAKYYQKGLNRSGKLYNQFSLAAAIHLDGLPVSYMPGTHNWICDRGFPVWDPVRRIFCAPYQDHAAISVMHLAGPAKSGRYRVRTTDGSSIFTSFRFGSQELPA